MQAFLALRRVLLDSTPRTLKIHVHVFSWALIIRRASKVLGRELGVWSLASQGLNPCSAIFLLCSLKQRNFVAFLRLSVIICRMGGRTTAQSCES